MNKRQRVDLQTVSFAPANRSFDDDKQRKGNLGSYAVDPLKVASAGAHGRLQEADHPQRKTENPHPTPLPPFPSFQSCHSLTISALLLSITSSFEHHVEFKSLLS